VMAMTACSSSDDAASNTGAATNNNAAAETTVATPIDQSGQLTEQELKEQALRETQTIYFAFDNTTIAGDYEEMLAA
ncbi:peptidoglycan-associated lipoprotein, partial [Vibrio alginolyticus]|nr:peptidoglycan-associated lipoprotein [Vibrio alginolyticus]